MYACLILYVLQLMFITRHNIRFKVNSKSKIVSLQYLHQSSLDKNIHWISDIFRCSSHLNIIVSFFRSIDLESVYYLYVCSSFLFQFYFVSVKIVKKNFGFYDIHFQIIKSVTPVIVLIELQVKVYVSSWNFWQKFLKINKLLFHFCFFCQNVYKKAFVI